MIKKRCFLQWFLLLLSYLTVALFTTVYGVPQNMFHTDITYMTSVIAVVFAATVGYLGYDYAPRLGFPRNQPALVGLTSAAHSAVGQSGG